METMMPTGAIEDRARRLSYVQGKLHSHITAKKYANLLTDLRAMKLKPQEKRLLKELSWDFELNHALPLKHVETLSHAQAVATHAWVSARKNNDWVGFLPHLEKLIQLKKREATYFKVKKPYDALLGLHDKEFNSTQIDKLFGQLKVGLSKLKLQVEKDGRFVTVNDLKGPFNLEAQKGISQHVAQLFGLSAETSRLDVSAHPFSINISPADQRITTRYDEAHLDSLSSTMHEVGHALYEAGLPLEWEGTPFQEAISLSVHESQSRFWENIVGRSKEFCHFIHPQMKRFFPEAMKGVGPDKLFLIMNKSVPGLIRVESSELYYNFHIIIRYEIEEMIFNQGLVAADIPRAWNEKYQSYLGIKPKTYADGVLQDSHWAGGAFGYFPTYTLGNLISGSLEVRMKREMKTFNKNIASGDFLVIKEWLRDNIHSKGRSITSHDIVGELKVDDYLSYLKEKFNVFK
jgi:carboxypeptidase Taq